MITPALLSLGLALAAEPAAAPDDDAWDVNAAHGPTHEAKLRLTEGTWMSVTVHGDQVVFDLLGDLWRIPVAGGQATRLTSGAAWDHSPRFSPDGTQLAYVSDAEGNENIWIMGADGTGARALTQETGDARYTDPVWDPSGPWIIGRRRTVDTRSIGVTELWQLHTSGEGKGFQLTSLDAHPHAGEATTDGANIWFSSRAGRFEYNHNPTGGLWRIDRLDRDTGEIHTVASGSGSAARPVLSPDGASLLLVSRDRTTTLLEVLDLASGARRVLADWLSPDQMEGFALHGVYPAMDWTDDGDLVLWAGGKLWRLGLDGARTEIPFVAEGTWTMHDVPRWTRDLTGPVAARVVRWPAWNAAGDVAFSAMGALWVRRAAGDLERVTGGTGYAPAWSPDGRSLAWTTWSDTEGGALQVRTRKLVETLPVTGEVVNPAWSADGTQLAVLRGVGGGPVAEAMADDPYLEIVLLTRDKKGWTTRVVTTTDNRGSNHRAPQLALRDGRVWFLEDRPVEGRKPEETALVSVQLDGKDRRDHLIFAGAEEISLSPDGEKVAWKQGHQAWVTDLPIWGKAVRVADGALPRTKLTDVVGDWVGWTPDGAAVTWAEGPVLKRLPLDRIAQAPADGDDAEDKPAPGAAADALDLALFLPRDRPDAKVAYTHARVVTMRGDEVLEDATVVVDGDRIASVEVGGAVPAGAAVVDLSGKTIIPGMIDVHAHLHYSAGDVLPEQDWRYQVSLDFGVTTVHDPSASTDLVFTQGERVAAGLMDGPRVFSTGFVLYGALANQGAETPDRDAALRHVQRLEAVGATSVKVYQQSQRAQRQWYADACRAEHVMCVAEGGGDLWQDLSMVADGYHSIEHSLPVAPLYADVREFLAASHTADTAGTAYTPTLLVAYGGLSGENWFYQHADPLQVDRLLRHWPRRLLDQTVWRRDILAHDGDWHHEEVARSAADALRAGTLVTLGAHGQLQGLGPHWELWGLGGPGAMTPHEALQAATINGARYLGIDDQLGTIEAGKLADLVVLTADPLADLHDSLSIDFVLKNGEIWR